MNTFIDIFTDYGDSKFVILPVPFDTTTSLVPGTRFGPGALLSASRGLEYYEMDTGERITHRIYTMPEDEPPLEPEKMVGWVENKVDKILKDDKFPILLGGEHTITLGVVNPILERYREPVILVFDAHYDLRDEYGGFRVSHATVMRRVSENMPVYFYGQRVASREELIYLKGNKSLFTGLDGLKGRKVYVSVDLDVLDPSVCPSVSNPEPGGLSFEGLLNVLKNVFDLNDVIGFDIVELQPVNNPFYGSYTAAVLLKKMIMMKQGRLNG